MIVYSETIAWLRWLSQRVRGEMSLMRVHEKSSLPVMTSRFGR